MSSPYYQDDSVTVHHGDCLDVLRTLPDASVDSVVTDPPYGLEFMGKEWDGADGFRRSLNAADAGRDNVFGRTSRTSPEYRALHTFQQWCELWAAECLRVLKPGGHLLAFGGTRTWHRLACAVEDAGFEVRDSIAWLYGSGFPKSLDVSKAIDKAAGAEREDGVPGPFAARRPNGQTGTLRLDGFTTLAELEAAAERGDKTPYGRDAATTLARHLARREATSQITAPATPDAETWQGWGTALKPAFEPIVVARKPLVGTVAANVLTHGTGALNIDGCRIGTGDALVRPAIVREDNDVLGKGLGAGVQTEPAGRWPANVILDESQADALDEQSGELNATGKRSDRSREASVDGTAWGVNNHKSTEYPGDTGGASRFFFIARKDNEPCPSTSTANTAASPSSHPRAHDGSVPSGAATSAHPDTASPTASPSTNGTPSASRQSAANGTKPTGSTDAASSLEQQHVRRTPTPSPASNAEPNQPTDTTTTTTSPSTSAGSADPAISSTTQTSVPGAPLDALGSRFTYVAKADAAERPRVNGVAHPTVKPLALMRWLVRLVTPPGGTVLEPFAGSGTTVEACIIEHFRCIAIERGAEYLPLIESRIARRRDPVRAIELAGEDMGLFDLDGEAS